MYTYFGGVGGSREEARAPPADTQTTPTTTYVSLLHMFPYYYTSIYVSPLSRSLSHIHTHRSWKSTRLSEK